MINNTLDLPSKMISIQWFGHSMWKIWNDEISIIIDPFADIGYPMPKDLTSDIVLSSHDHFDHNNFEIIGGDPQIIRTEGEFEVCGVNIRMIPTWHDETKGCERGPNLLLIFEICGKTILHCGDLGHDLSEDTISELGNIDILFIPVGGFYTIDAETAKNIVDKLSPKIVFPMHYKTDVLDFPIAEKEAYLNLISEYRQIDSNIVKLTETDFAEQQTIILNYQ